VRDHIIQRQRLEAVEQALQNPRQARKKDRKPEEPPEA
jgi:hypothetical protein